MPFAAWFREACVRAAKADIKRLKRGVPAHANVSREALLANVLRAGGNEADVDAAMAARRDTRTGMPMSHIPKGASRRIKVPTVADLRDIDSTRAMTPRQQAKAMASKMRGEEAPAEPRGYEVVEERPGKGGDQYLESIAVKRNKVLIQYGVESAEGVVTTPAPQSYDSTVSLPADVDPPEE